MKTSIINCPLCDKRHPVDIKERLSKTIIKNEEIEYLEKYYFCDESKEDSKEYVDGKLLNDNLLSARNAYRVKHGLLTSNQIVDIRNKYGVTQVELSKLLGWGEATISRYESKAIQEEPYDNILREINDNPLIALEYINKHRNNFNEDRYYEIKNNILGTFNEDTKEYISRGPLKAEYAMYLEPSEYNGNTPLDIDKLESCISYVARNIDNLHKTKLMKLLWYSDALSYKKYNKGITGLVYNHDDYGALPVGHYQIMALNNISFKTIEDEDKTMYEFIYNQRINEDILDKKEKEVLDKVIAKFKDYDSKKIISYMHKEEAYKQTNPKDKISYKFAKDLKEF